MARHIQPAKLGGLNAPQVLGYTPDPAATFAIGAPVALALGVIDEHAGGAVVTGLLGFALQGCTAGVPDFGSEVEIAIADENVEFMSQVYDSGGGAVRTLTAATAPAVGDQLSLVKVGTEWYVDEDDAVDVTVEITKVYIPQNVVLFKVIPSARHFS